MNTEFDDLPPALREAIRSHYPTPAASRGMDERVLCGARAHLIGRQRRWFVAAAAAVVAIGLTAGLVAITQTAISETSITVAENDRNHDGRFDILDALAAAQGGAAPQDVDRLANAVVRMEAVQ